MDESVAWEYSIDEIENTDALMQLLAMPHMKINAVPPAELKRFKEVGQAAVKKELYRSLDNETVDWWLKREDEIVGEIRAKKM